MKHRRLRLRECFLPFFLMAASACDGAPPHVEESRQLADSLLDSYTASSSPPTGATADSTLVFDDCPTASLAPRNLRLFIDATRSMAGFTGQTGAFTRFDEVLARLSTELGMGHVVLFGETGSANGLYQQVPFTRTLHQPGTYSRLNNPDYCLVEDLRSDSASTSLYVTDGVQSSEQFGQQAPMVRALRSWFDSGRGLEILALSSEFDGPAWSEQGRSWIGHAEVESRPFYLFIFAPTPGQASDMVNGLGNVLGDSLTRISFTPEPVSCFLDLGDVSGHFQKEAETHWVYYKDPYSSPAARQLSERLEPGSIQCEFSESYPLASMVAENTLHYYAWGGSDGGFSGPDDPPEGARFYTDSVVTGTTNGVTIPVRVEVPLTRGIGMYAAQLQVTPGRINPAIRELSTNSDSNLNDFDRTYRFHWLVESLVRSQLETMEFLTSLFVLIEP